MAQEAALEPVYLLFGSDRPKVRRALERLRARFEPSALEHLVAAKDAGRDAATGADAVAACNALGLFGNDGGKLVVVESAEKWTAEDACAVAAYLDNPVPGTVLALVAGEPVKGPLRDLCQRHGRVLVFDTPKPKDLPAWVREAFARLGAQADAEAARALIEIVGDDPVALETEAEKITTWADGEPVGRSEVESLAAPGGEDSAWAVTDALGERDAAALLVACERALEHEKPFILAMKLASHIELLRVARALADRGLGHVELAKRLRIHEFRARKALAHARNYSAEELDAAIVRLAELDAALKGASRLAPELELERALVELTGAPEPAGRRP